MAEAASRLYEAFVESDPATAIAVVEQARDAGMERERLFDELFVPAMARLGAAWASKEIDEVAFVQASVVAEQMTSFVMPQAAVADTGLSVLVGCLQGETHGFARNMIVSVLKEAGHRVVDVGVDARPAEFLEKVEETGARIVIACAETMAAAEVAGRLRGLLDTSGHQVVMLVAGGPFGADTGLARRSGANGVVRGAESALRLVERVAADLRGEGSVE